MSARDLTVTEIATAIYRVALVEEDDLRTLINAVCCRCNDALGSEHRAVDLLGEAADACPDVPQPRVEVESCGHCAGSGEGRFDGSTCSSCRGSGTERVTYTPPFQFTPLQQDRIAQQRKALFGDER